MNFLYVVFLAHKFGDYSNQGFLRPSVRTNNTSAKSQIVHTSVNEEFALVHRATVQLGPWFSRLIGDFSLLPFALSEFRISLTSRTKVTEHFNSLFW